MDGKLFWLIFLFGGLLLVKTSKVIISKMEVRCKAEISSLSVSFVNLKSGVSSNVTLDIKQELKNISVNFSKISRCHLRENFVQFLVAFSISNPLNPQSFSEILKYQINGCNLQASMKKNNFVRKIFTEVQKLSKLKIECPMKKVKFLI